MSVWVESSSGNCSGDMVVITVQIEIGYRMGA
jgi:hypothetical protein